MCAKRRGLPSDIRICKLKHGDLLVIRENHDRSVLTGRVKMISTVGNGGVREVHVKSKKGMRNVSKPNIQILHNSFMGGVDSFDQLCAIILSKGSLRSGIKPYGIFSLKWL